MYKTTTDGNSNKHLSSIERHLCVHVDFNCIMHFLNCASKPFTRATHNPRCALLHRYVLHPLCTVLSCSVSCILYNTNFTRWHTLFISAFSINYYASNRQKPQHTKYTHARTHTTWSIHKRAACTQHTQREEQHIQRVCVWVDIFPQSIVFTKRWHR